MLRKPPPPVRTVIITHQSKVIERHFQPPFLGLWAALLGLFLVFAALFLTFALTFDRFQASFASAAGTRSGALVAVNGGLMLATGLALARAIVAERRSPPNRLSGYLGIALLSLVGFLGTRLYGYYQAYQAGLVGLGDRPFTFSGPSPHEALLFFNFYFVISALHAVLVLLGGLVLAAILLGATLRRPPLRLEAWLTASGVYFGFLILVWLVSFFAFYLSGHFLN